MGAYSVNMNSELLAELARGLLQWYEFRPGCSILYDGTKEDHYVESLQGNDRQLSCVDISNGEIPESTFDYIVSITSLEKQPSPKDILVRWKKYLRPSGTLLLGLNNRLGIRYFCGDRDPYTKHNFDSIENYQHVYGNANKPFQGRMYSQTEIREMLSQAGWRKMKFFSVLPSLDSPSLLLDENAGSNEDLEGRITPVYNYPDTVFLEEETLYHTLLKEGMFHKTANAYLVECTMTGILSTVRQVTTSTERSRQDALLTIIYDNGTVKKKAAYPEGAIRLQQIAAASEDLAAHGLKVVPGHLEKNCYVMPYIEAETGQAYLKRLYHEDKEKFFLALNQFKDCILRSSEWISPDRNDGEGVTLRRGYVDLIPLNSFFVNGEFVFFDQEFCMPDYPANAILIRVVNSFYSQHPELYHSFPLHKMREFFGLDSNTDKWMDYDRKFITNLRRSSNLAAYHGKVWRNSTIVYNNRLYLNFPSISYQRIFVDALEGADTKKLILFGSGKYAQKFLEVYGNDYPVHAIVDNNPSCWGKKIKDITISSPKLLQSLSPGEYKVLVCIREYMSILEQLDDWGIREYSVFNPGQTYRQNLHPCQQKTDVKKRFHVGYIAGVFDLFHIGHLNLLRRAKEQCDYLIVGVVTDYGVRMGKKVEPFISFEERTEILRSCRYVDEVVEIPKDRPDTEDAWKMYHFDVQFSGSDYEHDPRWLEKKAFLEAHGATLVFFPYTQSTSSTRLKKLISKKLL